MDRLALGIKRALRRGVHRLDIVPLNLLMSRLDIVPLNLLMSPCRGGCAGHIGGGFLSELHKPVPGSAVHACTISRNLVRRRHSCPS